MRFQRIGRVSLAQNNQPKIQPAPSGLADLKAYASMPEAGSVSCNEEAQRNHRTTQREGQAPSEGEGVECLTLHK